MLSVRYVFLEEIEEKTLIPESKIFKISDKISKETFQKWPNSCERCFQRGHLAQNCCNPLRNKKYKKQYLIFNTMRFKIYIIHNQRVFKIKIISNESSHM